MTRTQLFVGPRGWMASLGLAASILLAVPTQAQAQGAPVIKDVVYATVDGMDLALDLYMPAGVQSPPLLVWVHGGAWRGGSGTWR